MVKDKRSSEHVRFVPRVTPTQPHQVLAFLSSISRGPCRQSRNYYPIATITMDNPASSSATPTPHSPLPQPTPELNNPLALDSPGVCWGSIQSPEKAFLSALNHDALKTPARRVAPLPLRMSSLSHPEADSDVEAKTHTILESSYEGTPETDALPFDGPWLTITASTDS